MMILDDFEVEVRRVQDKDSVIMTEKSELVNGPVGVLSVGRCEAEMGLLGRAEHMSTWSFSISITMALQIIRVARYVA
jgi:hypothetical protein